ncbi:MAG: phosphomethylpyrimidine synthase ThiC, partial [Dehalococcoidales bacterium]|nr:phosphomethylpyrimidine synthase ThiC [Dehalococcoidales bacterium]
MTQLEIAVRGDTSPQMLQVAKTESIDVEILREKIASGKVVIPANVRHIGLKPCGVGEGLSTKVNANIGTSSDYGDVTTELVKLKTALDAGADTVMDLSTGGDISAIRKAIVAASPSAIGTVPLYQAGIKAIQDHGAIVKMTLDDFFKAIEDNARDGVDFVTVHCGVTQGAIARLKQQGRVTDVVSRGGAFTLGWMLHNDKENPLYEQYDRLLEIA